MEAATAHVPPQNLEAEESVLGALMVSEIAMNPVILDVRLTEEDFYRERHRKIFHAIKRLYERSEPIDALTVSEFLAQQGELEQVGGREVVSNLASTVPVAGNARHYARIVQQNALLRRLLEASQRIQTSVYDREDEPVKLAENAERMLFQVAHEEQAEDFHEISEIVSREVDRLEELASGRAELSGTPSGFDHLDKITGGFQPGNLIILAARPGMGKSGFVANIAEHVSVQLERPVAFFSLEMSDSELAQRLIAKRARIPSDKLRKGQVGNDWAKVVKVGNELEKAPLWIDDSSDLSMLDLRAKARRLDSEMKGQGRSGLGLIIIDYIQLMRAEDSRINRVEQVGQMSRGLKILARELKVPVIALSQLSRAPEQRTGRDKRPILSDLRESGNLEQDADLVAFIYREDYYKNVDEENVDEEERAKLAGIAELIVRKNRNGPIDTVQLAFIEKYASFRTLARSDFDAPAAGDDAPPLVDAVDA
ncbi:MAG TPA: replicative DNA helicase [Solirubrobacterales bacterium]|nr:replicative DNA helicase [Solirubrobacterales bacterium]